MCFESQYVSGVLNVLNIVDLVTVLSITCYACDSWISFFPDREGSLYFTPTQKALAGTKWSCLPAKKIPQFKAWEQFDHGLPVATAQGSGLSLLHAVVLGSLENNMQMRMPIVFGLCCRSSEVKLRQIKGSDNVHRIKEQTKDDYERPPWLYSI